MVAQGPIGLVDATAADARPLPDSTGVLPQPVRRRPALIRRAPAALALAFLVAFGAGIGYAAMDDEPASPTVIDSAAAEK